MNPMGYTMTFCTRLCAAVRFVYYTIQGIISVIPKSEAFGADRQTDRRRDDEGPSMYTLRSYYKLYYVFTRSPPQTADDLPDRQRSIVFFYFAGGVVSINYFFSSLLLVACLLFRF